MSRPPQIHHATSEPYRFFGRREELALLSQALEEPKISLVALVGPGGQGKTAILQHWLGELTHRAKPLDGLFFWSFYRGKESDRCLRELYAYAAGLNPIADVSAAYCVDQLLPVLRRERWAVILDGTEVVQYESGPWRGRFIHPELGRLLEELAGEPLPGVVAVTTRFSLPDLEHRRGARLVELESLRGEFARQLLESLGVQGTPAELDAVAAAGGFHAKAIELLGTYLVRWHTGKASALRILPPAPALPGASSEEQCVAAVLTIHQRSLASESQDLLALATAFREPPTEHRLLQYLRSEAVSHLLHETWGRTYQSFKSRPPGWLKGQLEDLVRLRLLERVHAGRDADLGESETTVIDAHPLVRRAFSHVLGSSGHRQSAEARAGFLRGRPERRRPETFDEAREDIELFHAHCDAGLWNEADRTYVALENPKHRWLAPALERDLLLRFFPDGDWSRPPHWEGFGRYRSLALAFEMLGQFEEAVRIYRETDAALRGDSWLALGELQPVLAQPAMPEPWSMLWQAYRSHALCLAGRVDEAVTLACRLVPTDEYEWIHVFECLLRAGQLQAIDLESLRYRTPYRPVHRWSELARQRMEADYVRVVNGRTDPELARLYETLVEAYDRAGMPFERCLTRLGYARLLLARGEPTAAASVAGVVRELAERNRMRICLVEARHLQAIISSPLDASEPAQEKKLQLNKFRREIGFFGPWRP